MSLSPAFGIMGILYAVFMIAVAVLAVYALVLGHHLPAAAHSGAEAGCTARGAFEVKQNSQ